MATLLLSNAGAALGAGLFGPLGGVIGRAAGALAGSALDQRLFAKDKVINGPRLAEARIMGSVDGAPVPRLYGRARLGGQLIWATRFEEVRTTEQQGGKGAPGVSVASSAYFANFAIGICEGPISHVGRIWADGKELDRTRHEIRIHPGNDEQLPDPLIEAKQGAGNAPAYRGTAYAVFEGFPLEAFGNRIPQFSFEVVRSVGRLDKQVRAVTLIPGATEFGLSPVAVAAAGTAGTRIVNRNNSTHATDLEASLDELQALCPNLETVALVVAWFGSDLRAGECRVEPRVEYQSGGAPWSVSGLTRSGAVEVSRVDDRPAYGGTPSDATVLAAIGELKARGLKVFVYPFLMMDVPAGNSLPSPDGGPSQQAYPWRGSITCHPSRNALGSVDGTAIAASQVLQFCGSATAADFTASGDTVSCAANEWSFRRQILHYARLAQMAGGVDGFLIGSEMPGLSTVRDGAGAYPFVGQLVDLATEVRSILGPSVQLTYAADWSEYFGFAPGGASNDRYFHLDPLWAHPAISAVGIDNYMPLSDWRIGGDPGDPSARSGVDAQYLAANIERGEGFDWYYATHADRANGVRTPITDGSGEPWIWRYKDIRAWWLNAHHERIGGVRSATPTAWIAQSKPIWFTELGCGAVTMGANQPNVFADAKSGQSGLPHFSTGARSDLAQARFLSAHHDHWQSPANPVSAVYGGPMVDPGRMFLWAWDARPFPAFPANGQAWSDGASWHTGHWLNGRIGGCPLDDLLAAIGKDFGLEIETRCDGFLDGYVVPSPASARAVLEPLVTMHGLAAIDLAGTIRLEGRAYGDSSVVDLSMLADPGETPLVRIVREQETELPQGAELSHADLFNDFEDTVSHSRRLATASRRTASMQLPAVLPPSTAAGLVDGWLRETWIGREKLFLAVPPRFAALEAGDRITFDDNIVGVWRIDAIEDGEARRLQLTAVSRFDELPSRLPPPFSIGRTAIDFGKPHFVLMNLPIASGDGHPVIHHALDAEPWAGVYALWSSPGENGFSLRQTTSRRALTGVLAAPLVPGPLGRWDNARRIEVSLRRGSISSGADSLVLNGANAAAIQCANGEWEIMQFAQAELLSNGNWRLSRLLRAQQGTDGAMLAGAATGAQLVILDDNIGRLALAEGEAGLQLNWRAGNAADPVSGTNYTALTHLHMPLELRPYSPAHISATRLVGGDVEFRWIRRSRIGGDSWDAAEIPLGETAEAYRVEILNAGGMVLRTNTTPSPQWLYPLSDQIADHGAPPGAITLRIAQIANSGLPGTARTQTLVL